MHGASTNGNCIVSWLPHSVCTLLSADWSRSNRLGPLPVITRLVSTGYETNKSGDFETEWLFYCAMLQGVCCRNFYALALVLFNKGQVPPNSSHRMDRYFSSEKYIILETYIDLKAGETKSITFTKWGRTTTIHWTELAYTLSIRSIFWYEDLKEICYRKSFGLSDKILRVHTCTSTSEKPSGWKSCHG